MTNTNATNFRNNMFEYLNQAVLYNDVVHVNTKNGNAVILSEEDYSSIMETLYLLSHPKTAGEIQEALRESHDGCTEYHPGEEW